MREERNLTDQVPEGGVEQLPNGDEGSSSAHVLGPPCSSPVPPHPTLGRLERIGEPVRPAIVASIRTGPSGQIWDLVGKLKSSTYYGLVEIGPVGEETEGETDGTSD